MGMSVALEEAGDQDRQELPDALMEMAKAHARAAMAELADVVERAATAAMVVVVVMADMAHLEQ